MRQIRNTARKNERSSDRRKSTIVGLVSCIKGLDVYICMILVEVLKSLEEMENDGWPDWSTLLKGEKAMLAPLFISSFSSDVDVAILIVFCSKMEYLRCWEKEKLLSPIYKLLQEVLQSDFQDGFKAIKGLGGNGIRPCDRNPRVESGSKIGKKNARV